MAVLRFELLPLEYLYSFISLYKKKTIYDLVSAILLILKLEFKQEEREKQ